MNTLDARGYSCPEPLIMTKDAIAKGLPLKAHLPHEPVIPACADQVIQVVGLSGLGKPIKEAVHRPERVAELCGCTVEDLATPERVAKVLNYEALADHYVLNQTDISNAADQLGELLNKRYTLTQLKIPSRHL